MAVVEWVSIGTGLVTVLFALIIFFLSSAIRREQRADRNSVWQSVSPPLARGARRLAQHHDADHQVEQDNGS